MRLIPGDILKQVFDVPSSIFHPVQVQPRGFLYGFLYAERSRESDNGSSSRSLGFQSRSATSFSL